MSDLMLLIRVQARVATFLAGMTLDRLVALAEGRLSLAVVDESATRRQPEPEAPIPLPKTPPRTSAVFDAAGTATRLRNCSTLDEGTDLLATLNPKVAELKALAKALNIPSTGTKAELSKKILTLTLGGRSKHAALRHG
jgi:hypothetical protein